MAALMLLLGLLLAPVQGVTVTRTVTQVQVSTFIPTVTVNQNQCGGTSSSTSLQLCANILATWNPFSFSSNSSSSSSSSSTSTTSHTFTTTTTTTTRSSSVPSPSNLYTFLASDTEGLNIDSSGNIILSNPSSGLTAAFILNADGTLTSYGSNVNVFADFSNTVAKRAINTAYGLGFCLSESTLRRRGRPGGRIVIFPREIGADGKSYGQFSINDGLLQFDTNGSTYGWVNCVSNAVAIYDMASDDVPGSCGPIDLSASSVPAASYAQYYSAGLKKKSQINGVSTCSTSPPTSTSISTTSSQTGSGTTSLISGSDLPEVPTGTDTNTAPEAGFTSIDDPFPIFAMSALEEGTITVNDNLQLIMQNGNGTDFHGFQLTEDDGMVLYGANFSVYANTSVRDFNIIDRRAICYGDRIVLQLSLDGTYPSGATLGPFITDPSVGLILQDWVFLACDDDSHLELSFLDCPVRDSCSVVNPALFLLDALSRQQALYNGAVLSQRVVPTSTSIEFSTSSVVIVETNAVAAVRNILVAGGYFDFCSSELGLYATSTVTENEITIVATETTEATETLSIVNYSTTTIEEITTASIRQTTTTTTAPETTIYTTTSRSVSWTQLEILSRIYTTTYTETNLVHAFTSLTTVYTISFTTTTAVSKAATQTTPGTATYNGRRRRDVDFATLPRRLQDPSLTPTYIRSYDPSIVGSACGLYFDILSNYLGVSATSFTYLVGETNFIEMTETSYSSTTTSTASTSLDVLGITTSYSYTTTITSVSTSVSTKSFFVTTTTRTTTIATSSVTVEVKMASQTILTTTASSTTITTTVAPSKRVLCRPTHAPVNGRIPGQLIDPRNGIRVPFLNFTVGRSIPGSAQNERGYVYWTDLSPGWPESNSNPIIGEVRADKYLGTTGWAWIGQPFFVCPGTTYYVSIAYKWYSDRTDPHVGMSEDLVHLFKQSLFAMYISDLPQGQQYKVVNAYDSPGPRNSAGFLDLARFNRMTANFTATSGEVGIYFGLTWARKFDPQNPDQLSSSQYFYSYNKVYLHGFNLTDSPAPEEYLGRTWFLPN
ncbi:hypothetical protein TWF281_000071 [Arthrobotrys megalospora]